METPALSTVVDRLRGCYGTPKPPLTSDPFELVLYENVSYLVDDAHRIEAFQNLKSSIGTRPEDILTASPQKFESVVRLAGSDKKGRIAKLVSAANIAINDFADDVRSVLSLPFKKAVAALMKFPSIGEPSAEKILLFCGAAEALPLESNGLRVLVRVGYVNEETNYTAMYRNIRAAISEQIVKDRDWLISAHLLLRQHGQTICKRAKPLCSQCVLLEMCKYGQTHYARSN